MQEEKMPVPESAGMISFSRASGTTPLFGSDLVHQGFIRVLITKAAHYRSLSRVWYMSEDRKGYIEVWMSFSQFSEAITAMNQGDGVTCTVARLDGKSLEMPTLDNTRDLFDKDLDDISREALGELDELTALIASTNLSLKSKKTLTDTVKRVAMKLADSLPFVVKSYAERMEGLEVKAKNEISAYADHIIFQHGLNQLPELPESKTALEGVENEI